MANTYASLHYHIIFSTKNRESWIKPNVESRIWSYIGGIARTHKMTALQIGGCDDHIHALVQAPPIYSPSKIAQHLKGESSKWIHEEFPTMSRFGWQDGYGAFTVSKSQLPEAIRYIQRQREHHRKKTFQEEYKAFLKQYGIEYDERYLWG
jgi:REP element-mobilizing transposase RayT